LFFSECFRGLSGVGAGGGVGRGLACEVGLARPSLGRRWQVRLGWQGPVWAVVAKRAA
jgi:hypothetical protein